MPRSSDRTRGLRAANKKRKKEAKDKRVKRSWETANHSIPNEKRKLDESINMRPIFVDGLMRELRACLCRIYKPKVAWLGCGKGTEAAVFMMRTGSASAGVMLLLERMEEQARDALAALLAMGATAQPNGELHFYGWRVRVCAKDATDADLSAYNVIFSFAGANHHHVAAHVAAAVYAAPGTCGCMPTRMWRAAGVPTALRPPLATPQASFRTPGGSSFTLAASIIRPPPLRVGDIVHAHYRASSTPPDRRRERPWLEARVVRVHDAAHCDVHYPSQRETEQRVRRWFVRSKE